MTRCRFANKVSLLEIVREHAFDLFFGLEQENQIKKEASRMICEYKIRLIFFATSFNARSVEYSSIIAIL